MMAPLTADARIIAPVGIERRAPPGHLAGRLQIDRLAAHHAGGPGREGDHAQHPQLASRQGRSVRDRFACEERERFSLQAVARQNRDAVAVHDVQCRPAAPQCVVVHGREIVVNKRVGVNELDCAGGGKRQVESGPEGLHCSGSRDGIGSGKRQNRP